MRGKEEGGGGGENYGIVKKIVREEKYICYIGV
jgi:hypothetical protein